MYCCLDVFTITKAESRARCSIQLYDRVAMETDTHSEVYRTRITIPQDRFRDKYFAENECIHTVQLKTQYVGSSGKMQDDMIVAELKLYSQRGAVQTPYIHAHQKRF